MEGGLDGQTARTFDGPAGNLYEELKVQREGERLQAIKQGLIDDPDHPKSLEQATTFLGTCTDMCPRFEREQREYQNNVERWELDPATGRIDPHRAVKAFHRPAAGNEQALPSDVRPPHVLLETLDYLLDSILCGGDALELTHGFIRDRTRSIRQDFTLQNNRGPKAILCHERIARFHILSLHLMRAVTGFSEQQETEQLRKTLQSLAEYYNEQRQFGYTSPCEPEFRGYHILTRIRDPDVLRQVQTLPFEIQRSKHVKIALRLYNFAQRSNEELGRFKAPNCEGSQNLYTRYFKLLDSPFTNYLSACLCETHFTEVRKGALKAMRKAYMPQQGRILIDHLIQTLGFDDAEEVREFLEHFGVATVLDDSGHQLVEVHKNVFLDETDVFTLQSMSKRIVEAKRNAAPLSTLIRGLSTSEVSTKQLPQKITQMRTATSMSSASLPRRNSIASDAIIAPQVQHTIARETPVEVKSIALPTILDAPRLPPLSDFEPALKAASQLAFRQAVKEHLAVEIRQVSQHRILQNAHRDNIVQLIAKELCAGFLRDQLALSIRESFADMTRRRVLLMTAMTQLKRVLQHARLRESDALKRQELETQRKAAYNDALAALQKPLSTSLKRSHSALSRLEIPAAQDIHRIKTIAERFWQPIEPVPQWLLVADQHRLGRWTIYISVSDKNSPSSRWLANKFALYNDVSRNLAIEQGTALSKEEIKQLPAVFFECTTAWETSSQRLLEVLRDCASTSRVKCVLIIVSFETMSAEEAAQHLNLENIVTDPRSPVQSAWFVCMATMNRVDEFHTVVERALNSITYQLTLNEQERDYLDAQKLQVQADSKEEPKAVKPSGRPARSSFYDTHLKPLQSSKVVISPTMNTMLKPSIQTSALMRAIEEAKQTLSWAKAVDS